ncbi:transposase [Salinimicrobium tongyeongense]|uniref:Transposase n=1 Tax=Salinimicrobium tongyeongense TaxID=2809707 RepID=A0ABY6NPZ1_9FLAO|nr:transposase [Salinimicrobium tongyeongense]
MLYKAASNWTKKQSKRAEILFKEYPDIHKAYSLVNNLETFLTRLKTKVSL